MIQFLTLFLGLFTGPHAVELRVAEPVAAVEVRLDGRALATLDAAPWELTIDYGSELAPHQLVAVARDASGRELDRVRRWINVSIDDDPGDERTAVAVVLSPAVELPAVEAMQAWFAGAAGEPLQVVAVERGAAEVVVVRDPAVHGFWRVVNENYAPDETAIDKQRALQRAYALGADTRLRFLSPRAVPPSKADGPRSVFGCSASTPMPGGLLDFVDDLGDTGLASRLSDAVAVAGLELHAGARRRAVVLLVHGDSVDESLYAPGQVREYLARLQVPVFVWSIEGELPLAAWGGGYSLGRVPEVRSCLRKQCEPDGKYPLRAGEIPVPVVDALTELRRHLGRQRIVYLAGRHRPQDVRLRSGVGVRLASDAAARPAVSASADGAGRGEGKGR